jgi:radical SAM C-methyltransferase
MTVGVARKKVQVWIVHQALWDMPLLSIPLAPGYMKAYAMANDDIRSEIDIQIRNFRGGMSAPGLASDLFRFGHPDVIAFSTFGWNFHKFAAVAETFKQINPAGMVVFGGVHVSNQGDRLFRIYPWADVVVNGEGEITFQELLLAYLAGNRYELNHVPGLSYRLPDGTVVTTTARERIQDLESIPSPFLTGAIPMSDQFGNFLYDVGMLETNRGCPYSCSFCYWGGATGQKLRSFSRDRLKAELELFGKHKVPSICLCDSNFGMLPEDLAFVEDLVATRQRYGYPRRMDPSWAKNKSKVFFEIVQRMKAADLHATFTLALQSLDSTTLEFARRKNMKLNVWNDLSDWLISQNLECFVELIWGMPGETMQSFLDGYDRVARRITRIATYSLILIPNTEFSDNAEKYKFIKIRSEADFEHGIAHQSMTVEENAQMHRFLFWARIFPEHLYFRHIWRPLQTLAGFRQSEVLLSLDAWIETQDSSLARGVRACRNRVVERLDAGEIAHGLRYFYGEPGIEDLLSAWWQECILPRVPEDLRPFFLALLRYDLDTRPRLYGERRAEVLNEEYLHRQDLRYDYDVPAALAALEHGDERLLREPRPLQLDLYYKVGFGNVIDSHEVVLEYAGKTQEQLVREEHSRRRSGVEQAVIPGLALLSEPARGVTGPPQ